MPSIRAKQTSTRSGNLEWWGSVIKTPCDGKVPIMSSALFWPSMDLMSEVIMYLAVSNNYLLTFQP